MLKTMIEIPADPKMLAADDAFKCIGSLVINDLTALGWQSRLDDGSLTFKCRPQQLNFKPDIQMVTVYHTRSKDPKDMNFLKVILQRLTAIGKNCRLKPCERL